MNGTFFRATQSQKHIGDDEDRSGDGKRETQKWGLGGGGWVYKEFEARADGYAQQM